MCARNQINQHAIALAGLLHSQGDKTRLRGGQSIPALLVGNINANFAGGFSLLVGDGCDDAGIRQFVDKVFWFHLPTPAGSAAAKAAAAARKSTTATTASA